MEYQVPKYLQIKQDIIDAIKSGELKPGDKIDSGAVLKEKYKVSTITVRKAFDELINEDYLVGVQGLGTFVAKKHMNRRLTSISFSDELLQQGYKIDMQVDKIEELVNESIAEKLMIPKDQPILCVRRLRLVNNEPIAYQSSFMSGALISMEEVQRIHENKSFYKTLAEINIYPVVANENYSVREVNDSRIARLMNIKKNTDTFFVKRTAFDDAGKVIEYAETYFNKEWYSVTVEVKIKGE